MTLLNPPKCVMITGAAGNLGAKVLRALLMADWCEKVIALDCVSQPSEFDCFTKLSWIQSDLTQRHENWIGYLNNVDAIIHFAALNPVPNSSWADSVASFNMTQNLLVESVRHQVKRFVFVSSNHVMGAYKDEPLAKYIGPGKLTTALMPAPGTRWFNGETEMYSLNYGIAKLMGESLCTSLAETHQNRLRCVAVRIGWALTGANRPQDITHSGSPASRSAMQKLSVDEQRALSWFRNMWLSDRDLTQIFERSLLADSALWPSPAIIVNGVSNNQGMDWDLSDARKWLGYHPQDNVYDHL